MNYRARVERLVAGLAGHEIDALLITDLTNVRYLTGYTGSNGAVVVTPARSVFLTDFRYLERVAPLREFIDVNQANQDLIRFVSTRWAELAPGAARVGFESVHLSYAAHALLAEASELVENSIVEIRRLAHGIYPPQDFARRCEVPTTQTTTAARKRPRR